MQSETLRRKMVYITTNSLYLPVKGRLFEAFCEYDEYLFEAHKIAAEMAAIMGVRISDLRYRIFDLRMPIGVILSYDAKNINNPRVEDKRVINIAVDSLFPDKGAKLEWHQFMDVDFSEYEQLIAQTDGELMTDKEAHNGPF